MNKLKKQWENIVDILIEEINDNKYMKDEKMPSENDLAIRFSMPRTEVRRAYNKLKELCYIYSLQGCGSFFYGKREKLNLFLNEDTSFSEKFGNMNLSYQSINVESLQIPYDSLIYDMLEAEPSEKIFKITRLRMLEHKSAAIHTSYLSNKFFPKIEEDSKSITSIFNYMRQNGYKNFKNIETQINVSPLTKKEREFLQISSYESGLILSSRCIEKTTSQILEVERIIYRCDRFTFII